MFSYFFLTGGLLMGWSLGANDAANIFGTAVSSGIVKFKKAAIIASVFVILGAVLQGSGTTHTLSELGSVDALGGAFTIAICSAIVVALMTKYKLPVSTSQAIVGAILGWCYFTSTSIDYTVLTQIVGVWVVGPILGAVFSALLYLIVRRIIRKSTLHLIKMESIIRFSLIAVGALGAYSLGANNIANVVGVFVNSFKFTISFGGVNIGSVELLFFMGGLAVSFGILTYSRKIMETVGGGILALTPEAAIAVVLSLAMVLFIFSSTNLSNFSVLLGFPAIPLVPVSSTQIVVASVMAIGLVKGVHEIKINTIKTIAFSWVTTPVLSCFFTFLSLFLVKNIFDIQVSSKSEIIASPITQIVQPYHVHFPFELNTALFSLLIIALGSISLYFLVARFRNKETERLRELHFQEQMKYSEFQKSLSEIEVNTVQLENTTLASRLEEKRSELVTYSLNLGEQRLYLDSISKVMQQAIDEPDSDEKNIILKNQLITMKQKMSFTDEVDKIYRAAENVHKSFIENLNEQFPNLTHQDKRLLVLLRIGLSSKEISPLLNISIKSVEISRYRLRKKLNLDKDKNLVEFTKTI